MLREDEEHMAALEAENVRLRDIVDCADRALGRLESAVAAHTWDEETVPDRVRGGLLAVRYHLDRVHRMSDERNG